ncbi:hypothetical protein LQZ19_14780 [Treponema primitia]|uniref:hypothetical protein n=1 Tax=Treponema primitia TaxID=88058 RepID=UPI0039818B8D
MITLFKGIIFNPTTNKIAGSLDDYILMNDTYPGTTTSLKWASFAVKMFLLKRGTPKLQHWGHSRLEYITKNIFNIKSNPDFELIT